MKKPISEIIPLLQQLADEVLSEEPLVRKALVEELIPFLQQEDPNLTIDHNYFFKGDEGIPVRSLSEDWNTFTMTNLLTYANDLVKEKRMKEGLPPSPTTEAVDRWLEYKSVRITPENLRELL